MSDTQASLTGFAKDHSKRVAQRDVTISASRGIVFFNDRDQSGQMAALRINDEAARKLITELREAYPDLE